LIGELKGGNMPKVELTTDQLAAILSILDQITIKGSDAEAFVELRKAFVKALEEKPKKKDKKETG